MIKVQYRSRTNHAKQIRIPQLIPMWCMDFYSLVYGVITCKIIELLSYLITILCRHIYSYIWVVTKLIYISRMNYREGKGNTQYYC